MNSPPREGGGGASCGPQGAVVPPVSVMWSMLARCWEDLRPCFSGVGVVIEFPFGGGGGSHLAAGPLHYPPSMVGLFAG